MTTNRISSVTFFILLVLPACNRPTGGQGDAKLQATRWVTVTPSINLRDCPDLSCAVVGTIAYHDQIAVLETTVEKSTIQLLTGPWLRVRTIAPAPATGWVFEPLTSLAKVAPLTAQNVVGTHSPGQQPNPCNEVLHIFPDGTYEATVHFITAGLDCGVGPCPQIQQPICEIHRITGKWEISFGRFCFPDHQPKPTCVEANEAFTLVAEGIKFVLP